MVETWIKNLKRRKSLLDLTAEKIISNIDVFDRSLAFANLHIHLIRNLLERLTDLTCSESDRDITQFRSILNFFTILLQSKSKPAEIEIKGMVTFCPRSMWKVQLTKVLETIATMVPNLEALTFHMPYYNSMQAVLVRFDEKMLSYIGSLEKLKTIKVSNMTIDYVDLKEICKKLQSLIYVDVEFVYYGGLDFGDLEDFRNSFSRLKIFIFELKNRFHNNEYREEFVKICIGNLPMLQVLQGFILGRGGGSTLGPFPMDVELPSQTSSLRHLCINPIARPEVHTLFPCVTHLQVHWSSNESYTEEEINSLLNFSKVECLSLRSCPSEADLSKFLSAYGKNLHTLSISDPLKRKVQLKFGPISDSCPQLECLHVCDVEIVDDGQPFECFAELNTKRVYLSKILNAPKLETLITSGVQYYDVNDLKEVEKLIADKQILQELKSFVFNLDDAFFTTPFQESINAITEMLQNLFPSLPRLREVNFWFYFDLRFYYLLPVEERHRLVRNRGSDFLNFKLFEPI